MSVPTVWPRGSIVCLALVILSLFILQPLMLDVYAQGIVIESIRTLMVVIVIYTFNKSKSALLFSLFLGVPFIILQWMGILLNNPLYMKMGYLFAFFFFISTMVVLGRWILLSQSMDRNHLLGAIIFYIMFGIIWAMLYNVVYTMIPGSFNGIQKIDPTKSFVLNHAKQHLDFVYLSITTMTCVGCGDINPVHSLARMMVSLEAICGQLFVVVVISRLVTLWNKDGCEKSTLISDGD